MNYLFFDIECATGIKSFSPICNFGYLLTDEEFKVLKQEDIIINPRAKFKLTGRKNQDDVKLHYSENDYKKAPIFKTVYPKIKSILEKSDQIVLGHAVINDIRFLIFEILRYDLESFDFLAYDTQKIYKQYHTEFSSLNLSLISEEFGMKEEHKHKADDDALKTMNYVKVMCRNLELTLTELLNVSGNFKYDFLEQQKLYILNKRRLEFKCLLDKPKIKEKLKQEFSGIIISFSKKIEKDYENSLILVQRLIDMGGKYTSKVSDCHIYVHNNEVGSSRMQSAKIEQSERIIEIIDLQTFQMRLFGFLKNI